MFNFINIYSFIDVSGCVDMDPSVVLCLGAYNVAKTVLHHEHHSNYCKMWKLG